MEPSELEKTLNELEEKMDRVRALYEQYFVGIEKLEPQIPRKDCDRIIVQLRKEQIRNTAMRFKFQTLVQRYNTMQQHWGRITREIENGTYKRDLMKAAARFGVEDALTAVGRKHAARLRGAVEKKGGKQAKKGADDEFYEELSVSDIEVEADDFDDDAPTPPPQRPAVYEISDEPDPMAHAMVSGFDAPMTTDVDATYTGEPAPHARRPAYDGGYSGSGAPSFHIPDPLDGVVSTPEPAAPAAKKGGLRWGGGGGARKADPEALKRIANLAGGNPEAVTNAPPKEQPATREHPMGRKPLLSNPIDLGIPDDDEPPPPPPPKPAIVEQRKPLLSSPIDLDLGLPPSEPPPPMKVEKIEKKPEPAPKPAAPAAEEKSEPKPVSESKKLELQRPKPQLRPPPSGGESAAAKREFGDLNDGRLREIYGQYVQSRRDRNESTAGITFEKLADSLKSQADKLKGKHNKRVDYEIVVKDGKTLIKPIVK